MQLILWLLLIVLMDLDEANANLSCPHSFGIKTHFAKHYPSYEEVRDRPTKDFFAYISYLVENHFVSMSDFIIFTNALEAGILLNPVDEIKSFTDSSFSLHRSAVKEILEVNELNKELLIAFSKTLLKEMDLIRVNRKEFSLQTRNSFRDIEFCSIPVDNLNGREVDGTKKLAQFYKIMTTPVTQGQWLEIMGGNPSYFKFGEDQTEFVIDGKRFVLQPDHPVESVNWWSALVFANKLSERHGLAPAYNLTNIEWVKNTRAENGTLFPKSSCRIDSMDIKGHPEGFRLPTPTEYSLLLNLARVEDGRSFLEINEEEVRYYSWCRENSYDKTHPVASLNPLYIFGESIYDLRGNIYEWSSEQLLKSEQLINGGGRNYTSWSRDVLNPGETLWKSDEQNNRLGLRLIRTTLDK